MTIRNENGDRLLARQVSKAVKLHLQYLVMLLSKTLAKHTRSKEGMLSQEQQNVLEGKINTRGLVNAARLTLHSSQSYRMLLRQRQVMGLHMIVPGSFKLGRTLVVTEEIKCRL